MDIEFNERENKTMKNYCEMTKEELLEEQKKIEKKLWDLEMSDRMTATMWEEYRELYRHKFWILDLLENF